MPGNKRPKRRAGGKKPVSAKAESDKSPPGGKAPTASGAKSAAKSYGTPKSSRGPVGPMMTRRSPRGR